MPTPNLTITHIAASQNQKEVTANAAFDALDRALCDQLSLDFAAGNVTLTSGQFRSAMVFRTANLTVARDLIVPAVKRLFVVNNSDAFDTLTVRCGTTSADVAAGSLALLQTDGTADGLFGVAGATAAAPQTYLLAGSFPGKPGASQRIFHHLAVTGFTVPSGLTGSFAKAKGTATAQADFDLVVEGVPKGTIRWPAAGTAATFVSASGATVSAGDEIEIIAPAGADATLADLV